MESITKYRILLLKDYEENSMAVNYLEWAKNDSLLDEQKEETPNAKIDIFKNNGDLLFIYTNSTQTDNPLASEQNEFVDQYISVAMKEASSMNTECYFLDNTKGRHQEQLLFDAMDTNMRSFYDNVWRAVGKSVEQINELKQVYTSATSTTPVKTNAFEVPVEIPEPSGNDNTDIKDEEIVIETKHNEVGTEDENPELSDRELLVSLLHKIDQQSIEIRELKKAIGKLSSSNISVEKSKEEIIEEEPKCKEPELTPEEKLLPVRNYAADVEKEQKDQIEDLKSEEGVPVVQPEEKVIDTTGNAAVGGLYQNTVFYPKNPAKKEQIESEPAQLSQTETEVVTADLPEESEKTPISSSKGNESNEETVIYNSVESTETLWEKLLGEAGTESELSTLIVENYSELPKSIQDEFLRFNMFDKYKSGKTTTLSKVEAVKRKVKVKKI